jgi:hypothetical protein
LNDDGTLLVTYSWPAYKKPEIQEINVYDLKTGNVKYTFGKEFYNFGKISSHDICGSVNDCLIAFLVVKEDFGVGSSSGSGVGSSSGSSSGSGSGSNIPTSNSVYIYKISDGSFFTKFDLPANYYGHIKLSIQGSETEGATIVLGFDEAYNTTVNDVTGEVVIICISSTGDVDSSLLTDVGAK